jgi:hypothetical protein
MNDFTFLAAFIEIHGWPCCLVGIAVPASIFAGIFYLGRKSK